MPNIEGGSGNQFLTLFSQFENFLAENFPGNNNSERINEAFNDHRFETEVERLGFSRDDLHNLRRLRNLLVHRPNYLNLSTDALADLNKLVLAFCKQAKDLATPREKIYAVGLDSPVQEIVQRMDQENFSFVPVIDQGIFIGLFSKSVVLKLVANEKLGKETTIRDIQEFLSQENMEDSYEFLRTTAPAEAAYRLFAKYIDRGKHLGVVFLTEDGKKSGNIIGLITAWDLYKLKS